VPIAVRKQKRRRRRLLLLGVSIALLAAAGGLLARLPLSLQEFTSILQLAAGRLSQPSADIPSAEDVLRGTVYDRRYRELAVSYQIYSLFALPVKINRPEAVARQLSAIIGQDASVLTPLLKSRQRVVQLADDLDQDQMDRVRALNLQGVYGLGSEQRYYPANRGAAHVLGFTSEGMGIAGVEARWDLLLKPGGYRPETVPDVDFGGREQLGRLGSDLVLTLDLDLQRLLDDALARVMEAHDGIVGAALVLDPVSGAVRAMASRPGFNPNYFWRADGEERVNQAYAPRFTPALLDALLTRIGARMRLGATPEPLLPVTIAAPAYGLSERDILRVGARLGLFRPVSDPLPVEGAHHEFHRDGTGISLVQIGVTLAGLVNGGWRPRPVFLEAVYDRELQQTFPRRGGGSRVSVLEPAMGVAIRRDVTGDRRPDHPLFTLAASGLRTLADGGVSRTVRQHLFAALTGREKNDLLLVMAIEERGVGPEPAQKQGPTLAGAGSRLLDELTRVWKDLPTRPVHPDGNDPENLARFLIARRIDFQPRTHQEMAENGRMPGVTGLSLRKGLQRLNRYGLDIVVRGSGRIVQQNPAPGALVREGSSCLLILEPES